MRDLFREAGASLRMRAGRALITSLGICLGVAALLSTVTMAESASASIKSKLEKVAVTTLTVRLTLAQDDYPLATIAAAESNLRSIEHVVGVGSSVDLTNIVSTPVVHPELQRAPIKATVLAVSPSFPSAVAADGKGSLLSSSASIIGSLSADLLKMPGGSDALVFVGGRPFAVSGIAHRGAIDQRVDGSVQIPLSSAHRFGWLEYADEALIVVRTNPGMAEEIAPIAAVAASPKDPDRADVSVSPDPRRLREGIESDTLLLVSALAALLLGVGLFSIANVMLTSVLERTGEIGLRRAIGASRTDIAVILLAESAAIGVAGGCIGTLLGLGGSLVVAEVRGWPLDLQLWRFAVAPIAGGLVGSVAGTYPAVRAARMDPVVALQR